MSGVRKRADHSLFCCELDGWKVAPGELDCSPAAPKEQNLSVGQHLQLEMDKISLSTPPLAPTGPAFRCLLIQNPAHSPRAMQGQIQSLWGFMQNETMGPLSKKREKSKMKVTQI